VIVLPAEHPAEVPVPEAAEDGRMRIALAVGEAMVAPVTARPPEGAVLHRRTAEPSQNELEDSAGLERVVGEVAVVARGHAERLEEVARDSQTDDAPRAHERRERAESVDADDDPRRTEVHQSRP